MKRLFLTLAVLPVLALAQANPSGIFLDVLGHPHEAYVDLLRSRGIVQGYGYGIFRPDILINRAEFLKILMLAVHGGEVYAIKDRNCFRDFTGPEQWFWSHVCTAKSRGIVEGYPDGAFRGEQPVILAEALKMTAETYGVPFPQYVQAPPNWYDPSMDLAATRGLFDYFPFNPGHLLTRSEMAYLIVRFGEPIAYLQGVQGPSSSSRRSSPSTVSSKPPSQPPSSSCGNGFLDPGEQCDDGNRRDGDGCSSICILVKEPIRHAAMRIEQRELLSTGYASGVQDVTLLAFDAIAGRQDAWLTGVILVRGSGSFTAATNFRLFADLDGNGTAERAVATASPQGARLAFHNFQVRTPQSIAVRFEVRADLSTTSGSDRLGIAFATDDAGFISAAGEDDGQDLTGIVLNDEDCGASLCWIRVLTAPLSVISVHTVGSLYVTRDSVPVSSRQLLAGGTTDVLLRLTLRAVKEDIELKRIAIQGASSNADRLEILEAGGSSPFAIARSAQCPVLIAGQYCASSSFAIPEGKEKRIVVRAVVKADTAGVDTSQTVALSLTATTGMQHAIEARGKFSGVDLQQNDGDGSEEGEMYVGTASPAANVAITGPTSDVVLSKIEAITNGSDDPDDTPVPSGTATIAAFRFAAAQHSNSKDGLDKAQIRTLVFSVTASNVELDPGSFELYNTLNSSVKVACSANQPTLEITVTCSNIHQSQVASSMDPGGSIRLALRARITNPQIVGGGSSLQTRLTSLSDRKTTGTITWHDGSRVLQWVDLPISTVRSTLYRSR